MCVECDPSKLSASLCPGYDPSIDVYAQRLLQLPCGHLFTKEYLDVQLFFQEEHQLSSGPFTNLHPHCPTCKEPNLHATNRYRAHILKRRSIINFVKTTLSQQKYLKEIKQFEFTPSTQMGSTSKLKSVAAYYADFQKKNSRILQITGAILVEMCQALDRLYQTVVSFENSLYSDALHLRFQQVLFCFFRDFLMFLSYDLNLLTKCFSRNVLHIYHNTKILFIVKKL